jgi:transposase-like protein
MGRRATKKTAIMYEIETRFGGKDIKDVLIETYNTTGTIANVAETLGVETSTVSKWLTKFNLSIISTIAATPTDEPASRTPVLG